MVQKIKTRLRSLANAVKDKIKREVHTVVELLKKRVRDIKMKLEGITASLEEYVKELGTWMDDAKEYINDVKKYVNDIMEQLNGENRKAIDEAVAEIDSELGKKVEALNQWIKDAEAAVKAAKEKADEVYGRLDKDSSTTIGGGLKKIEAAKGKIESVNSELNTVHKDLVGWKDATHGVIRKAAEKVGEVSDKLDPSQHGAGNPIGKNLNEINTSNEDIKRANEELKNQVTKLNDWITDADELRQKAQEKAEEVYDSLKVHDKLSGKIKEIQTANTEIQSVHRELSNVDKVLKDWKQETESVIQDVVEKAKEVYKKLDDKDGQQLIGQGIKHIEDAKQNVVEVGNRLKSVNDDLEKWRKAAEIVLGIAIERAKHVHDKLDPAKDKSTLGSEIDKIDTARQAIVNANKELERQVKSLNKWIETAEDIRNKAEEKAKEAYDKLQVHEALSENVKKIVDANNAIKTVYSAVDNNVKELGRWKDEAEKVITGAVGKAQEVHDALDIADKGKQLNEQMEGIAKANVAIQDANKTLEENVDRLGNWNTAAGRVIEMADKKCDEILKRVDKNHKDHQGKTKNPEIYVKAKELQDQGTKLLKAAEVAKQTVESKVKDALDAVKAMDSALKKDLKVVKDEIKKGITEVIKDFGVDKLGEKVQKDLKLLREKIEGLNKGDKLVDDKLARLTKDHQKLEKMAQEIKDVTVEKLVRNFNEKIKKPLDDNVKAVETAIGELYKKINPPDGNTSSSKNKIEDIIGHINDKVGNILNGEKPANKKGLQGIANGLIKEYASGFASGRYGFDAIVQGWIGESVLRSNGVVWKNLGCHSDTPPKDISGTAGGIKNRLKREMENGFRGVQVDQFNDKGIANTLNKVKKACETFANALDGKLKERHSERSGIVFKVRDAFNNHSRNYQTPATEAVLCALSTASRQVSKEIHSILLDNRVGNGKDKTSIAAELDKTLKVTEDLNTKLTNATTNSTTSEANPADGTAQAVDKAIEGAKTEVGGLDAKFKEVKKPVDEAVKTLDAAVTEYDEQAKEQVREAAKGAIDKAAKVISEKGGQVELGKNGLMQGFKDAHEKIKTQLPSDLQALIDKQLPSKAHKVDINKAPGFKGYDKHVYVGTVTNTAYGALSLAIEKVRDEGLTEINKHVGKRAAEMIKETDISGSFGKIEKELNQIAELVSDQRQSSFGGLGPNRHSLKEFLKRLKDGLGDGKVEGADKGFDAITKAIVNLQSDNFGPKSRAIEKAVEEIKLKVEELKKKLKGEQDTKDDVINALTYLQKHGLASETWNGKGGVPVDGLKKIESELRKQNDDLGKQPGIIRSAINKIQSELKKIGYRLNDELAYDDVVDRLLRLEMHIGKDDPRNGNLQQIHDEISKLRVNQFGKNTDKIDQSRKAIKTELRMLHYLLQNGKDNDVIETLKDLMGAGFGLGEWRKYDNEKGHEAIEKELERQQKMLTGPPKQIDAGVKLITTVLEELRKELKSESGNPNNSLMRILEDVKEKGLGGETKSWNGKDGLKPIQKDLKKQNDKLAEASEKIQQATESVLQQTQSVLRSAEQKLSGDILGDTIVQKLEELRKKIGFNKNGKDDSLQGIQREISRLQAGPFDEKSKAIGEAKHKLEHELTGLKGELDGQVTNPLKALMEQGLGDDKNWNGKKAKGFDHIKRNLQSQQSDLSTQPKQIDLGMKEITGELDDIRNVLHGKEGNTENRGVIRNLQFMTNHIGESENTGLKKIKSDMETLKNDQGKGITDNLDKLSRDIQDAAAYADWHVSQLDNPHIDGKLKGIQGGLDKLRFADLAEAIKLCDDFLIKADEIEKNTIDALLKYIDDEVDDAIGDLTKEARVLYVDSVREALALFARKVNEDLEQLPNEINRDRYVGYKGFTRYLQGPLSSNLTGHEQSVAELSSAFQEVFDQIEKYVSGEITRLHDEQNKEQNPLLPPTAEPYTPKLNDVYKALTELLVYLRDNDGGTDRLTELVERLTKALSNMLPSDFKHPSTPLLDTVTRGLSKFADEFGNTYISAYSGQRCREEHAHKYAKVLLSMIPMTYKALTKLATKCESEWKSLHICKLTSDDKDNPLGNYLTRCGYRVSSSGSEQDGELNNMFTGGGIYELLTTPMEDVAVEMLVNGEQVKNGINFVTIISLLYNTLCHYFQACHIYVSPEPRYPCTVRDMLSWLSGL